MCVPKTLLQPASVFCTSISKYHQLNQLIYHLRNRDYYYTLWHSNQYNLHVHVESERGERGRESERREERE